MLERSSSPFRRRVTGLLVAATGVLGAVAALVAALPARAGAPGTQEPAPSRETAPSQERVEPAVRDEPTERAEPAAGVRRAERVLIISEDGLRGDILSQLKLPWHEALYRAGAWSWKARTIRTASTLPSHAAMLSGFDVEQHGLTWNNWRPNRGYIRVPTIFDEALEHGMKSAMFVGKFKLRHIARPGTVSVFERPGYYCKRVAADAAEYLVREKPTLAFVHFSNPDEAGHSKGWNSDDYSRAVSEDDRCLGVIVDALDKSGMTDSTLIIISADHGGHGHNHSGGCMVDREIPWIAFGPGVRTNHHIRSPISTVDTAATALHALGLSIPQEAAGRPVTEIWAN